MKEQVNNNSGNMEARGIWNIRQNEYRDILQVASIDNLTSAAERTIRKANKKLNSQRSAYCREKWTQVIDYCQNINMEDLRLSLLEGNFKWSPVHRVRIPKGNGKTRDIGIATTADQVIGQAIRQVLEPRCEEKIFLPENHAFRAGKGVYTAINEVLTHWENGRCFGLKVDLSTFFDSITHGILNRKLQTALRLDGHLIHCMNQMLKAGYHYKGRRYATRRGVIQGHVISPLLANIYGTAIDERLRNGGYTFIRYADDILFMATSMTECECALSDLKSITKELKLNINEEKTEAKPIEKLTFLGFGFCNYQVNIPERRKARFSEQLKNIYQMRQDIDSLYRSARGWCSYYHKANPALPADTDIDWLDEVICSITQIPQSATLINHSQNKVIRYDRTLLKPSHFVSAAS